MDYMELYRKARNGDYRELTGLDEFELIRFIGYLVQRLREMETERIVKSISKTSQDSL